MAPPLKATAKVLPRPLLLRLAALTAAFTVIFRERIPAIAESAAPTAKAMPFEGCKKAPIITARPIDMGIIIFISRFTNAEAPSFTAFEISCISFVPGDCFETHTARPPATRKEASTAPIGRNSCKSILYLHAYTWEI